MCIVIVVIFPSPGNGNQRGGGSGPEDTKQETSHNKAQKTNTQQKAQTHTTKSDPHAVDSHFQIVEYLLLFPKQAWPVGVPADIKGSRL